MKTGFALKHPGAVGGMGGPEKNRCNKIGQTLPLKLADGYMEVHYTIVSILCMSEKFYN